MPGFRPSPEATAPHVGWGLPFTYEEAFDAREIDGPAISYAWVIRPSGTHSANLSWPIASITSRFISVSTGRGARLLQRQGNSGDALCEGLPGIEHIRNVSHAHDLVLDFLCIDPSAQLQDTLLDQRASVFFSGTLTPSSYFIKLITPDMKPEFFDIPSPFPHENCAYLVHDGLSTRWKDRERNLGLYAQAVREAFGSVSGNQIVFSPSFAFQDALLSRLLDGGLPPEGWVIQRPGMSNREKDEFVAAFREGGSGVRGFAVSGGSFSESIDLAGDRLVGALIFGVGLPQVNVFNDTCRDFFEAKLGNGYAWAYLYPGLNRALQAAGRVIRSEEDRGFVCLIDERYGTAEHRRLLPEHWDLKSIGVPGDFARGLPPGLDGPGRMGNPCLTFACILPIFYNAYDPDSASDTRRARRPAGAPLSRASR